MDLSLTVELVERLSRLREEGALTDQEFVEAKSNVLQQSVGMAAPLGVSEEPKGESTAVGKVAILTTSIAVLIGVGLIAITKDWRGSARAEPSIAKSEALANNGPSNIPEQSETLSDAQSEADSLEAQANALSAEGEGDAESPLSPESQERTSERMIVETRAARCRVKVGDLGMTGPCTFNAFSNSEFEVTQAESDFKAQVVERSGVNHAIIIGRDSSVKDLGPLIQKGACWNNANAEICAWAI